MNPMNEAWMLLKGMNPMDDPRISGHLSPANPVGIGSFKTHLEEGQTFDPNSVVVEQEVTRMPRPSARPIGSNLEQFIRLKRQARPLRHRRITRLAAPNEKSSIRINDIIENTGN